MAINLTANINSILSLILKQMSNSHDNDYVSPWIDFVNYKALCICFANGGITFGIY